LLKNAFTQICCWIEIKYFILGTQNNGHSEETIRQKPIPLGVQEQFLRLFFGFESQERASKLCLPFA
jgi:hypothetical protein